MTELGNTARSRLMADKKEFRGYIPTELNKLVRAVAALKDDDKDWSLSDVLTEALQEWLQKPENQALIKKHNLAPSPEREAES